MRRFLDTLELDDLPARENERFEYKNSQTTFELISQKLPKAASAFWNSGGGTILFGVDDAAGKPDGGIPTVKSRQPIRDWLDTVISNVPNAAPYHIRIYVPTGAPDLNISPDRCVAAIHFDRYQGAPVMASDSKYYIRAGAHSVPATGFIVEALFANRQASIPVLTHTLRMKQNDDDVVQLGIVALSNAPALNVKIDFDPRPKNYGGPTSYLPLNVPVVSLDHPFFMDYTMWYDDDDHQDVNVEVKVQFNELSGSSHQYSAKIDIKRSITPMKARGSHSVPTLLEAIQKSIDGLAKAKQPKAKR